MTLDVLAGAADPDPPGIPGLTALVAALVVVGWAFVAVRGLVAMFGG
jgi:hypothetical protein